MPAVTKINKKSIVARSLVFGVGINDSKYPVETVVDGKRVRCSFYGRWRSMLERCYSERLHEKYPTYKGCSVCNKWLLFSNFKLWMKKQDWEGKHLDKDLLIQWNKIYSPETCLFVPQEINLLLTDHAAARGDYPIGVHLLKSGKFKSACSVNGKKVHIGHFDTAEQAGASYKEFKYKLISKIAKDQKEPLKSALLNYKLRS